MDSIDVNWVQVVFRVPPTNVSPYGAVLYKAAGGVNSPDLIQFLIDQLIPLADGTARFAYYCWCSIDSLDQMSVIHQGFEVATKGIGGLDLEKQKRMVLLKFDRISIVGTTIPNGFVASGYRVDRLIV